MVATIEDTAKRAVALSLHTTDRGPVFAQRNIGCQLESDTVEIHRLVVDLVRQGQNIFLVLQFVRIRFRTLARPQLGGIVR